MTPKLAFALVAAVVLGLAPSIALAQTAQQHNAPGGPRDRVETLIDRSGFTLPPPPPTPPSAPVSTGTVTSPPANPPATKK